MRIILVAALSDFPGRSGPDGLTPLREGILFWSRALVLRHNAIYRAIASPLQKWLGGYGYRGAFELEETTRRLMGTL